MVFGLLLAFPFVFPEHWVLNMGFFALLARYAGQEDFAVGIASAGFGGWRVSPAPSRAQRRPPTPR